MKGKTPIRVTPVCYLYAALLMLLLPLQWLLALTISIAVHEIGHFAALRLLRIPVNAIVIHPTGIRMQAYPDSPVKELFCAAAGPGLGFSLILLARWLPGLAVLAAFHSIYNLLPVYPCDGGRILCSCCHLLFPAVWAERIVKLTGVVTSIFLVALGIYATAVMKLGMLPMVLGVGIVANAAKNRK